MTTIITPLGDAVDESNGQFCGHACGFHCTRKQFDKAVAEAETAALGMPGWTANVWENGRWHWNLIREVGEVRWHLSLNTKQRWECYSYGGGQQVWTCGFNTPQEAVSRAVDALRKQIARATRDIHALTGVEL